jgi:RNA polymerase sigma-70 factor (ECF subfamily)
VLAGEVALFELIIRRYNQRLFRVTRSVLKDDAEAEDAMQEAYVNAFTKLASSRGDAKLSTWLTRIALHAALARSKKRRGGMSVIDGHEEYVMADESPSTPRARSVHRRAARRLRLARRRSHEHRRSRGLPRDR